MFFLMKGMMMLFVSLVLGYGLLVVAKKQEGILKSLGYILGIAIMIIAILFSILSAPAKCHMVGKKFSEMCGKAYQSCCHETKAPQK